MKLSSKRAVLTAVFAVLLLLFVADEYPALRFRGDGHFSGGPVFGYSIRLRPIPFYQSGEYVLHLQGMPSQEWSLWLHAEGTSHDDLSELASILTHLNTQVEALLSDQDGRVMCRARAIEAPFKGWGKVGTEAIYWHENCCRIRLKPADAYTLKLRIQAIDAKTPRINLIPILRGGGREWP